MSLADARVETVEDTEATMAELRSRSIVSKSAA
jgi:hypothetical protein